MPRSRSRLSSFGYDFWVAPIKIANKLLMLLIIGTVHYSTQICKTQIILKPSGLVRQVTWVHTPSMGVAMVARPSRSNGCPNCSSRACPEHGTIYFDDLRCILYTCSYIIYIYKFEHYSKYIYVYINILKICAWA